MVEHDHWIFFAGEFMWVIWILLAIVIALLACKLIDKTNCRFSLTNRSEKPLDTLKRRYAQGEIDVEEFTRKSNELSK